MAELLAKEEVYRIVGAGMEVHSQLGAGFLEAVYREVLGIEFASRGIPFLPDQRLIIRYKGVELKKFYITDFVCFGSIIVEVKATERLTSKDEAQLLNYLTATGYRVGVLINFGNPDGLEWKRMVR